MFITAESLKSREAATSQQHYLKAIEKLDHVEPQVRFVAKNQYVQASHNIGYYRALSYQNLWFQTKDEVYLNQAYKHWRDYLAVAKQAGDKAQFKRLIANATTLYKQAKATIESKEKTESE